MQERRDLIPNIQPERTDLQRPFEPKLPAAAEPYQNYRGGDVAEEGIRFKDYWRAIRKRLWLVIGVAVLVTTLAAIYMSRRPDLFVAKARVQVDLEQINPELQTKDSRAPMVNSDPAYFNTQLQILNSPKLLRRVIKEANLENNKDFMAGKTDASRSSLTNLLRLVGLAGEKKKESDDAIGVSTDSGTANGEDLAEAKRLAPAVELIQKTIAVEPVREGRTINKETRLIDVSFQHTNPELAALVVNTVAETFTKQNQEKKFKNSDKTSDFLQKRVAELQAELKGDEERKAQILRKSGTLVLNKDQSEALERLQGLQKFLLEAENDRKSAETELNAALQPGALDARAAELAKKFVEDTTLKINDLKQRRELLLEEFQLDAPEVKEIDKQLNFLSQEPDNYRNKVRKDLERNLRTKFEQARQKEAQISSQYAKQYSVAQVQNEAGISAKLLQQRIDTNNNLLDSLLQQVKTNDITAAGTDNNISVLDPAIPPTEPVGPRRLMTVLFALFLSLAFGCGLALFLEYLDDTIRTTEDVENILRLPALAVIPTFDTAPRRKLLLAGAEDADGKPRHEMLITSDSRSALAEAYRQLRTSVLLSTAGHAPKSLLITSSVPSEGKTTTAINTAISLAQTGAKVLIIDADMRRPRLHSIFQVSNAQGLSSILSSQLEEDEMLEIIQHDEATNLFLLPSGAVPPNPAELIGSEQMRRFLQIMEGNFTHVVVDSPPIASFTDGVLISTMVDGVLLVVHSGKSSRQIVKRAKQLLQDVGAKMFGVVLNNVNARSGDKDYQNYYNSYYNDAD